MATRYEETCDACGKVTKGFYSEAKWGDKEYAENCWTVRVDNSWLEDVEEGKLLRHDRELSLDACQGCSKILAEAIRAKVVEIKANR